jgi:hypothetical protein
VVRARHPLACSMTQIHTAGSPSSSLSARTEHRGRARTCSASARRHADPTAEVLPRSGRRAPRRQVRRPQQMLMDGRGRPDPPPRSRRARAHGRGGSCLTAWSAIRQRGRRADRVRDAHRGGSDHATAKTHVIRAMTRLGARDRAQLVALAYQHRLVEPPDPAPRRHRTGRSRAEIDPTVARAGYAARCC